MDGKSNCWNGAWVDIGEKLEAIIAVDLSGGLAAWADFSTGRPVCMIRMR